jgi:hypothetical protein
MLSPPDLYSFRSPNDCLSARWLSSWTFELERYDAFQLNFIATRLHLVVLQHASSAKDDWGRDFHAPRTGLQQASDVHAVDGILLAEVPCARANEVSITFVNVVRIHSHTCRLRLCRCCRDRRSPRIGTPP